LIQALSWVGQYIITPNGFVTFLVAAGQWVYTTSIEINHANSNRIAIQGGALLGGSPTPGNISVTGYHSSTDGTNQIIYLRSVYATELQFANGQTGFFIYRGGATLRYLLITGSQTTVGVLGGCGVYAFEQLWLDGVAVWGFGSWGLRADMGAIRSQTSLSICTLYCGTGGAYIQNGYLSMATAAQYFISCSHGVTSLHLFGSLAWIGKLDARGDNPSSGNAAIHVEQGSQLALNAGSVISQNANVGVIVAGASTFQGEQVTYSSIGPVSGIGLYMDGGKAWVDNSVFSGNAGTDILCIGGANCEAIGASFASSSPPVNTYGQNYNAFISH